MENVSTNGSESKCHFVEKDASLQVRYYLMPVICTTIAILNFSVVISSGLLLKRGQEPKSTYLFLGNIAMADFLTGCSLLLGQFFLQHGQTHYCCLVLLGVIVSAVVVSIYSVGLIAVDRFCYILHGMKYQRYIYPTRARMLIGVTWVIGIIIGFLPITGWANDTENGKCCWFVHVAHRELVILTAVLAFIPFLVVLVLYSIILFNALKKIKQINKSASNIKSAEPIEDNANHPRQFRGSMSSDTNEQIKAKGFFKWFRSKPSTTDNVPRKWKAIKVVLFTTGGFLITWIPFLVVNLIYVLKCENGSEKCDKIFLLLKGPLPLLAYMNCLINPIIYAWWHKGFREFIKNRIRIYKTKRNNVTPALGHARSRSTSTISTTDVAE